MHNVLGPSLIIRAHVSSSFLFFLSYDTYKDKYLDLDIIAVYDYTGVGRSFYYVFDTLRPRQNGLYFAQLFSKCPINITQV